MLDRHRRPVSQRPMKALCVVKVDPSGNAGLGFVPVGIVLQIDVLVFQGPPKALDEDIVHPASSVTHRPTAADAASGCMIRRKRNGPDFQLGITCPWSS